MYKYKEKSKKSMKRYNAIDALRGFSIINMMIYHTIWDLVYIFGFNWAWYRSHAAYIWQQFICYTFIILSGLCIPLSKRKLKRGITVFIFGIVISIVTIIAMPQDKVIFGILTLIGSCMMLIIPIEKILKRINPYYGITINIFLFIVTRNINRGYLIFYKLPQFLYKNMLTAYIGFPPASFSSTDYFALFPWIFLFISGYFLYYILDENNLLCKLEKSRFAPLEWMGQHSLMIYVFHQPVIYFLLYLLFRV